MRKNNNHGFSLVELIVVVLIMGIIAVALAPQVMKWVKNARESADFNAKDELKLTAQVALAEFESKVGAGILQDENYNVTSTGVVVVGGTEKNIGMKDLLEEYLEGEYPTVQSESGKVFQIQLKAEGKKISVVTVN